MKTYNSINELLSSIESCMDIKNEAYKIIDEKRFREEIIDQLAYNMCLSDDQGLREAISYIVWKAAKQFGIIPPLSTNSTNQGEMGPIMALQCLP